MWHYQLAYMSKIGITQLNKYGVNDDKENKK